MAETPLTWSDWPASRQRGRAVGAAVLIALTGVAIAQIDPWLGVFGVIVLVLATGEVLLPTRYEVGPDGLVASRAFSRRKVPWSQLVDYRRVPEGWLVQGKGSRPILARRRTVRLRCPGRESEVEAVLARYLGAEE